jgi:hypothetical protein
VGVCPLFLFGPPDFAGRGQDLVITASFLVASAEFEDAIMDDETAE